MVLLLLIIFLAIMLIGTPVGFAMGALTNISFGILGGDQSMVAQKLFSGIDTYTYVCVLLFILATDLMSVGGITSAIVNFCEKIVGHVKGGLAHVNVLASMLFAGLSGSAIADASGLGPLAEEFGIYYDSFAKLLEKEQQTKKERGKVTAATTGISPLPLPRPVPLSAPSFLLPTL